jgi:glycerol-3-phosphate O-acyltransferase
MGFFMRHLGAFTVDRKKSDPLYLETVKEYATVLLERGQHLLFFPGGTRSRSGAIESHLKLGFLSRVVGAFVNRRLRDPHSPPLFVVPCTLSYPLVLEAASLIEQYLSKEGGPNFLDVRDEFERPASWLAFLTGLSELDVQIHVRFGRPLDPFGNAIDADGVSRDGGGRALDAMRYLMVDGAVTRDDARDAEYSHALAERVLTGYKRETVALPSSVLAFALFTCLRRRYPRLDLFHCLRVLGPNATVTLAELGPELDAVLAALKLLAAKGALQLAPELSARGKAAVLDSGVRTLSKYHRPAALLRHAGAIEVTQPTLLLYYRNRLEGFGLPGSTEHTHSPQRWRTV